MENQEEEKSILLTIVTKYPCTEFLRDDPSNEDEGHNHVELD
jgi:hypothetical protein